ncbi:MAG TPA: adenylate/guanylate cyclase domain-containing protein [Candidatus Acidoferrales bacterium]|nr:adenylate/guanylate cyclase domain-containing protein [Candidatus Acidoferrales bacterium]
MSRASEAQEPQKPVPLPTGTVTFLFTDIEGSTQRWEQHREAMDAAVKRHDQLLRSVIERHNGYVFKTVGDAVCATFARVSDAISASVDAQRELNREDFSAVDGLRIRAGIHTGEASERGGDYFGPAVNRVARLMSIGHGGQILLSGVTRDLAHNDLPKGATLVDLGSHRLKDLAEPEQVWQLSIENLPSIFPQLHSLDEFPNNLSVQTTSFRGREQDLEEAKVLLGQHHVLTLTGSGGVGKTRLAVQVGAELLDQFPDGVWFADMAPITDPELVSSVVASALSIEQVQGKRVDELIPQRLKRKKLLLIIDNCEHLLGAVAVLVDAIQRNAPDVRTLCTSRQALGIAGEIAHRLPSLSVPEASPTLTADEAIHHGSIAVFVDRARSADTRFALTDDNAPIVAEICRHLDGIPLAIELAAARVKVLSIPNLAQRLNERFKILTGGSRTALPRQKTLSALIDWSYDLLTPQEQTLFQRLGIFAGGFGLDAATKVCGGKGLDEIEVLDLLGSLTDKSLVVADTTGEQERYHLLESTRAYALEKLAAAGEHEQLARGHAEYFRDLAQAADERFGIGSAFAWIADVELDLDNYRAALEWSITRGNDDAVGGAIAGALDWLWRNGSLVVEGRYWTGLAFERVSDAEHPRVAARLWFALSNFSTAKAKVEAAEHAVELYESVGDARGAARAQHSLAFGLIQMGRLDEADNIIALALAGSRKCGDRSYVANGLNAQAVISKSRNDTKTAKDLFGQAIAAFRALGLDSGISLGLGNLAELEFQDGHAEEAVRLVEEALEIYRRVKSAEALASNNSNLAAYRAALGAVEGARESARTGLRLAREAQSSVFAAIAVQHLGLIAAMAGQESHAAQLLGYVDAQFKAFGYQREFTEQWSYDKLKAALSERLSDAEIEKLAAEGAAWSEDQAVEEALKV